MSKFDLGKALKDYRLKNHLSMRKMGKNLLMSKSSYERLEKNKRNPGYNEVERISKLEALDLPLALISVDPSPAKRWYQSKKWRCVTPIIIAYVSLTTIADTVSFQAGFPKDNSPVAPLILIGVVFCFHYWYYWPPGWPFWPTEWPFKKARK